VATGAFLVFFRPFSVIHLLQVLEKQNIAFLQEEEHGESIQT